MQDNTLDKAKSWQLFNRISQRYDRVNRLMTFGLDQYWRREIARFLPSKNQMVLCDLATGTADVPIMLLSTQDTIHEITAIDPAENMLAIGREKVKKAGLANRIHLQLGNAEKTGLDSNSIDAITISFGIRNVPDINAAITECRRILKPNGRLIILETSKPENPIKRALHTLYMSLIMPILAGIASGDFGAYRYLHKTTDDFPSGQAFLNILAKNGFAQTAAHPYSLGAVSIYTGDKASAH